MYYYFTRQWPPPSSGSEATLSPLAFQLIQLSPSVRLNQRQHARKSKKGPHNLSVFVAITDPPIWLWWARKSCRGQAPWWPTLFRDDHMVLLARRGRCGWGGGAALLLVWFILVPCSAAEPQTAAAPIAPPTPASLRPTVSRRNQPPAGRDVLFPAVIWLIATLCPYSLSPLRPPRPQPLPFTI